MIVTNLQEQLWNAVRRAWTTIARVAGIAALAGIAFGEAFGYALNGGHMTAFVHLASLVLGLVAAYGAAVTVGVFTAVRGLFRALTEVESGIRSSVNGGWQIIEAEHAPPKP
jgi:hypothetical protein